MEERKAFTMLRSYYEAAKTIPDQATQAKFLMAILSYGFDDEEPELTGWAASMFALVKPNIDANKKRTGRSTQESESNREVTSKSLLSHTEVKPKSPHHNENEYEYENDKGQGIKDSTPQEPPKGAKNEQPKVQWAEFVTMTNAEHDKLLATYGPADTQRLIEILDNYKGSTGRTYKSDYRAILSWAVGRLGEENAKKAAGKPAEVTYTDLGG